MKRPVVLMGAVCAVVAIGVLPAIAGPRMQASGDRTAGGSEPSVAAQTAGERPSTVSETAPATLASNQAGATLAPRAGAAVSTDRSRPARERPQTTAERPERSPEPMRLACDGVVHESSPAIACRWSPSRHPDFAAYALWRSEGSGREIVFRTDNRSHTQHLDTDVRPGEVYMYGIQALDADGKVIGTGGPVRAKAGHERPHRPEELRLACRPVQHHEDPAIACRWSESRHPQFAAYVVWRGDGSEREVVFRTDDRSHTRHLDTGVRPGQSYMYVVHAIDADGNVIGTGGPVRAQAPASDQPSIQSRAGAGDAGASR